MISSHNTDIDIPFYNDRIKEVIDSGIIAEPFTYVPIIAGHVELVGGNAVVFGKITEGYDVIDPDIDVEIAYEDITYYGGPIGSDFVWQGVPIVEMAIEFEQMLTPVITYPFVTNYSPFIEYHYNEQVKQGTRFFKSVSDHNQNNSPASNCGPGDPWWEMQPSQVISHRTIYGSVVITIPLVIHAGAYYNVSVENTKTPIAAMTAYYQAQVGDTWVQVKAGLLADMTTKGFEIDAPMTAYAGNHIYIYDRNKWYSETPVREAGDITSMYISLGFAFRAYILDLGFTLKYPQLKCGAVHAFGIVYKDRAGRTCSVMKTSAMDVYIPFYAEDTDALLGSLAKLIFKVNHKPPDWAETYEIVYFGNISMDYFVQIRADSISKLSYGNHRYSLNIQETFDWTYLQNNRWKLPPYVWNPEGGDRMRLIGTIDESSGVVTKYDELYDYEIEETGTEYGDAPIGGDWLIFQAVSQPTPFEGAVNILVEIYRPKKGLSQTIAYGTGMVFDIATDVYGNKYHKGDVDQVMDSAGVSTTPASVENTANDSYKFIRLNYNHNEEDIRPFWAESIFPSDWWDDQDMNRKLTSMGFPFLDDLSQRQTVLDERIRHGGFLVTGTRTNNLAHFTYADFLDLPKKNGDITGLREVGFTLKVIQMYKETSIYINRIQTFNPDGTEQFTLTDKFLAEQRPMETDFGCQHPDSIMVNGRNMYYWDNSQGVFVRSSPNGQVVLDIKMKRWFKDLVKWIQTSGGKDLLETRTGANNDHDEVWVTFRMGDEIKGLIFSEKQGRYLSELNQITESYIHLGNFFAHLYHQKIWIMNVDEGQEYLSWAGVQTYAEVEVVSNIESLKNKIFNAVAVFADHLLQSLSKYVHIPAEASGSNDAMASNIPVFDRREGVYYGSILRDEDSPGYTAGSNAAKMNGRVLRGRYCFLKFKTEEHTEKVRIDSIVIMSTPSERNV